MVSNPKSMDKEKQGKYDIECILGLENFTKSKTSIFWKFLITLKKWYDSLLRCSLTAHCKCSLAWLIDEDLDTMSGLQIIIIIDIY